MPQRLLTPNEGCSPGCVLPRCQAPCSGLLARRRRSPSERAAPPPAEPLRRCRQRRAETVAALATPWSRVPLWSDAGPRSVTEARTARQHRPSRWHLRNSATRTAASRPGGAKGRGSRRCRLQRPGARKRARARRSAWAPLKRGEPRWTLNRRSPAQRQRARPSGQQGTLGRPNRNRPVRLSVKSRRGPVDPNRCTRSIGCR